MEAAMGVNLPAVATATIAAWLFGAVYYGALSKPWMKSAGLTEQDILGESGRPSLVPYVISLLLEFVMAYVLAAMLIHTRLEPGSTITFGEALAGALFIWIGFVATTMTVNHRYTLRPWSQTIIDGAHWLGVLLVMAAVLYWFGL